MTDSPPCDQPPAVAGSFPREDRRARVRRVLEQQHLDAIVAVGPRYATWLAGYHRYCGGLTATLIGPSDGVEIVASVDEARVIEALGTATRVHVYGEPGFGLDLDPLPSLVTALSRVEGLRGCARLGVAGLAPSVLQHVQISEVVPVDVELGAVMAVKDLDEAEKIARSYNLCLEAQAAVGRGVAEGASELELFTLAHSTAQMEAGEPVEFISDLLSGPNSAEVSGPVAVAGPRQPARGEPVIADILVRAAGYWGDTCRTHVRDANGELDGLGQQLASVLDESVAGLRPGVRAKDVYVDMARRLQEVFPDSPRLPHHAGHSLGLDPVDAPNLSPRDDTPLEVGMILAVEPGVYFPGRFGMRLENEYLVTPSGGVELNVALSCLSRGANE